MSELQPLPIVDDRSIEQIRADGCERWPDGSPYIKDGVCCVCGANVEQAKYPVHVCLVKLDKPHTCGLCVQESGVWTGPAYWMAGDTSVCDKHIADMLEQLPDNREWLAPALADIRERHLKVGARVRIQCACSEIGQFGTITRPNRNDDAWYVRPDSRRADDKGLLCLPEELDVML